MVIFTISPDHVSTVNELLKDSGELIDGETNTRVQEGDIIKYTVNISSKLFEEKIKPYVHAYIGNVSRDSKL